MYQQPEINRQRWIRTTEGSYIALRHIVALAPDLVIVGEDTFWRIRAQAVNGGASYVDMLFDSAREAEAGIVDLLGGKDFDE